MPELEINYLLFTVYCLLTKTGFHASNRRSLLSEFELSKFCCKVGTKALVATVKIKKILLQEQHYGTNDRSEFPGRSYFHGRSGFPVILAFRSFWFSGRSDFSFVLAFRSFWFSSPSGFPVVLAFQSFWLSSRSGFPVIPDFSSAFNSLQSKEI